MLNRKKVSMVLLSVVGSGIMFCNDAVSAFKYAKISWVGNKKTGKTTMQNIIKNVGKGLRNWGPSYDINSNEVILKCKSDDVIGFFWDLPGEEDSDQSVFIKEIFEKGGNVRDEQVAIDDKTLQDFYADSNVAIVMIDARNIFDKEKNCVNEASTPLVHAEAVLQRCPNCKIVFGIINLSDEKNLVLKNKVVKHIKSNYCEGYLAPNVAGWIEIPSIADLSSEKGRKKCKEEVLQFVKKAIEMYGVENLPNTSENLHGKLNIVTITEQAEVIDNPGFLGIFGRTYKRKTIVVGKKAEIKKY